MPKEQETEFRNIGLKVGLPSKVPSSFHITLAYQFKEIPSDKKSLIEIEIQRAINKVINSHGRTFIIAEAKLVYFQDMTKFTQWDAKSNPFRKEAFEAHTSKQSSVDLSSSNTGLAKLCRFFRQLLTSSSTAPDSEEKKNPNSLSKK